MKAPRMEIAPSFTRLNSSGTPVSLFDFRGKYVLIYFYPRAFTPGCTTQACEVNTGLSNLEKLGVSVIGISPDSQNQLQRFQQTHDLHFELLSDTDHRVSEAYGVWGPKTLYGKISLGITRTSFAISPDGVIIKVWRNVKAAKHYENVYQWFSTYLGGK